VRITIIYGTERKGATYNIAQEVVKNIENSEVTEVFLPRDLPEYCISCFRCFTEEQGTCAHSRYTNQILEKLLWADLIILTSPVYSFHVSGQMKVFLDHFANMFIVHRPYKEMFHKQGLVIATASGPVYSKTLNEMKDSLDLWGVAKTYKLGFALMEVDWDKISAKIKKKITKNAKAIATNIKTNDGNIKPYFRVRKWFYLSRFMHKKLKLNPPDVLYWEEQGWTGSIRPWHK
jgi:multimeric flavodoxin WrbA